MPRKICEDCKGEYGRYRWTEIRDDIPCEECAERRRQDLVTQAAHTRQLEIRQAELKADVQKTKEEEETKRLEAKERSKQLEIQQQMQAAEIQAKNEQQRIEARVVEAKTKLRLEEEKTKQVDSQNKRDNMKEETKQLERKCAINNANADREVKLKQEQTEQVNAQNEQKRKEIEAVERTKQLDLAAKLVSVLAEIGTDKATINAQLRMMLGGELPPEKIEKVSLPPPPNTIQFKFLENMTKEQPKASKRKIERQRVRTAPVTVGFD
ncbi:inner centromere protein B-like [Halichondria panicea]|uniref:inner centromere protein B-like n=1 Tax=Halichondria panicea TaxID=6063 RepID=UPI00312B8A1C